MQLLHDMSAIHGGLSKYVKYSNSWYAQVKEKKTRVKGLDQLLKAAKEQEAKLKEKVITLKKPWEMAIQDLEAWMFKKEEALIKEQVHFVEVESWLIQTEDLLY